ncbi:WD40 repeat domain-containing protein, partial [Singulisphaera rosea]
HRVAVTPPEPRTDRYGDPLPVGAAMRLGTVQFRQPFMQNPLFSRDGRFVLTDEFGGRIQVWDSRDGRRLRKVELGIDYISNFALSPDGQTIAAIGFQSSSGMDLTKFRLTLTNLTTGLRTGQFEFDDQQGPQTIVYAPDGKYIATMREDGPMRLWDLAAARLLYEERMAEWTSSSVAFSPQPAGYRLAFADSRAIHLRDPARREDIRTIPLDGELQPTSLAFSPDGRTLASACSGGWPTITLWKVDDGSAVWRFSRSEHATEVRLTFSPNGAVIAVKGMVEDKDSVVLLDTATGKESEELASSIPASHSLAFSPDSKTVATTWQHQSLHLWDLRTGKDRLATPEAHVGDVRALASIDGGKTLVSGSDDRTVRFWDLATGQPTKTLALGGWVQSLSVSADGSRIAADVSYPKTEIQVWSLKTGEFIRSLLLGHENIGAIHLNENGESVVALTEDRILHTWDVSTGKELATKTMIPEEPRSQNGIYPFFTDAGFSDNGQLVAFSSLGELKVVDVASGLLRFTATSTGSFAFAPDGRSLVVTKHDPSSTTGPAVDGSRSSASTALSKVLRLDARTGDIRGEILVPKPGAKRLAFSPDGKALALSTDSRRKGEFLRIIRLRDNKELYTFEVPSPWIQSLTFLPDGKRIAAGLDDTSILVWDIPKME